MNEPIFIVDAFAEKPFSGNPAAVCLLDEPRHHDWMQALAAEMNLSETAFLSPENGGYQLRWFTPTIEVDLCGHATLASAHVLWREGRLKPDADARFQTKSGLLTAHRIGDEIELNFPAAPAAPIQVSPELRKAIGAKPVWTGKNRFDYLIQLDNETTVRNLDPDTRALANESVRGMIVTARSDDQRFDFVSRFFCPAAGIDEDPVTGSAHCCLGPYWQTHLNKSEFRAHQASKRGGTLGVRCAKDRVHLTGQAITILRGVLGET